MRGWRGHPIPKSPPRSKFTVERGAYYVGAIEGLLMAITASVLLQLGTACSSSVENEPDLQGIPPAQLRHHEATEFSGDVVAGRRFAADTRLKSEYGRVGVGMFSSGPPDVAIPPQVLFGRSECDQFFADAQLSRDNCGNPNMMLVYLYYHRRQSGHMGSDTVWFYHVAPYYRSATMPLVFGATLTPCGAKIKGCVKS